LITVYRKLIPGYDENPGFQQERELFMKIGVTGSIAYDYLMTFPGHFRDHFLEDKLDKISLSFLVERMVKRRGGIAPNIGYSMALLGEEPVLFGTVGVDFQEYREWLDKIGVDTSGICVIQNEFTASFFATTDRDNNQIASFYPGAMGHAEEVRLKDWSGPKLDLVVISPNDPEAMKAYVNEAQDLNIPYLYDPSQQIVRLTGAELKTGVEAAFALFVNEYEYCLIQKHTEMSEAELESMLPLMVVTSGGDGAVITANGEQYQIPIVPPQKIVDPTGVGDAFRGGFLTGYSRGFDWELCGQMGNLAATYCLESDGPQGHNYSIGEYIERFRNHYDDGGQLDQLLSK
jgi:adenosine kinase